MQQKKHSITKTSPSLQQKSPSLRARPFVVQIFQSSPAE
ncbi:hypothetical protein Ae717Ps2_6418c [Pseudonocardia sp. Ae717_Ps2]|nr:hypothetical protein Ae717Ps2_6352c [Pseudonocardia sp. Ae717_Ps2]OLM28477.1 hypothetical protein Ae717Ps2_6373c [Pseudonocardia sp. Ae717_Ps2]OLM28498.1 hypothetical protein Ae717Ps2_6394c [Pseudonocardia sp. Ae717_Ps2]OLM28522.1 hypothetical protein Ae717Ps2_6418c [Pseudonocardia sp. Ae717_Ps2]